MSETETRTELEQLRIRVNELVNELNRVQRHVEADWRVWETLVKRPWFRFFVWLWPLPHSGFEAHRLGPVLFRRERKPRVLMPDAYDPDADTASSEKPTRRKTTADRKPRLADIAASVRDEA